MEVAVQRRLASMLGRYLSGMTAETNLGPGNDVPIATTVIAVVASGRPDDKLSNFSMLTLPEL